MPASPRSTSAPLRPSRAAASSSSSCAHSRARPRSTRSSIRLFKRDHRCARWREESTLACGWTRCPGYRPGRPTGATGPIERDDPFTRHEEKEIQVTTSPTHRFSHSSMVAVAQYSTRSEVGLAELTLFAAGIPYVIATDPVDLTEQVLVNPADLEDAAAILV